MNFNVNDPYDLKNSKDEYSLVSLFQNVTSNDNNVNGNTNTVTVSDLINNGIFSVFLLLFISSIISLLSNLSIIFIILTFKPWRNETSIKQTNNSNPNHNSNLNLGLNHNLNLFIRNQNSNLSNNAIARENPHSSPSYPGQRDKGPFTFTLSQSQPLTLFAFQALFAIALFDLLSNIFMIAHSVKFMSFNPSDSQTEYPSSSSSSYNYNYSDRFGGLCNVLLTFYFTLKINYFIWSAALIQNFFKISKIQPNPNQNKNSNQNLTNRNLHHSVNNNNNDNSPRLNSISMRLESKKEKEKQNLTINVLPINSNQNHLNNRLNNPNANKNGHLSLSVSSKRPGPGGKGIRRGKNLFSSRKSNGNNVSFFQSLSPLNKMIIVSFFSSILIALITSILQRGPYIPPELDDLNGGVICVTPVAYDIILLTLAAFFIIFSIKIMFSIKHQILQVLGFKSQVYSLPSQLLHHHSHIINLDNTNNNNNINKNNVNNISSNNNKSESFSNHNPDLVTDMYHNNNRRLSMIGSMLKNREWELRSQRDIREFVFWPIFFIIIMIPFFIILLICVCLSSMNWNSFRLFFYFTSIIILESQGFINLLVFIFNIQNVRDRILSIFCCRSIKIVITPVEPKKISSGIILVKPQPLHPSSAKVSNQENNPDNTIRRFNNRDALTHSFSLRRNPNMDPIGTNNEPIFHYGHYQRAEEEEEEEDQGQRLGQKHGHGHGHGHGQAVGVGVPVAADDDDSDSTDSSDDIMNNINRNPKTSGLIDNENLSLHPELNLKINAANNLNVDEKLNYNSPRADLFRNHNYDSNSYDVDHQLNLYASSLIDMKDSEDEPKPNLKPKPNPLFTFSAGQPQSLPLSNRINPNTSNVPLNHHVIDPASFNEMTVIPTLATRKKDSLTIIQSPILSDGVIARLNTQTSLTNFKFDQPFIEDHNHSNNPNTNSNNNNHNHNNAGGGEYTLENSDEQLSTIEITSQDFLINKSHPQENSLS